jgi:hypothetical protein
MRDAIGICQAITEPSKEEFDGIAEAVLSA